MGSLVLRLVSGFIGGGAGSIALVRRHHTDRSTLPAHGFQAFVTLMGITFLISG